jgi:hypothetical protein
MFLVRVRVGILEMSVFFGSAVLQRSAHTSVRCH